MLELYTVYIPIKVPLPPLRKNHMKKPTCESRVKLEQHFTCDPHVVKTHVIHMWNTCDFTMGDFLTTTCG